MSKLIILVIIFCFTSCSSDNANRFYGKKRLPPKDRDKVEVFFSEPKQGYEPIADFQAQGSTSLIEKFRGNAAYVGADAVIITITNENYDRSTEWAGDGIKKQNSIPFFLNRRVYGTAIVFTENNK